MKVAMLWLTAAGMALAWCVSACSDDDAGGPRGNSDAGPADGSMGGSAGAAGNAGSGGVHAGGAGGWDGGSDSAAGGAATGGSAGSSGAAGAGGNPGVPAVRFVGRFDNSDPKGPQFEWSGSLMHARFSGTEVSVHLDGAKNWFQAVVDGKASKVEFPGGDQVITLASGLEPGEHEVRLFRITEAFHWSSQFLGFNFGSGSLLPPPASPDRRLEVVGDSISAGYGVEGVDQYCSFSADTENHYLTYESIAARDLGADLITLAWSGIGMVRDYAGETTSQMPGKYLLTMPDFPGKPWDFTTWIPHAVVINLGTNDFAKGDPGQPFVDAYLKFVTDMRLRYPSAMIYAAVSPMMSGADRVALTQHLASVVQVRTSQGDTKIKGLEFTTAPEDGYGCDWHPSQATNQKMAAVMAAALKADLGW